MSNEAKPTSPERTPLTSPEWASGYSALQFVEFGALVQTRLEARGWPVTLASPEVLHEPKSGPAFRFSLESLAKVCRTQKATKWPETVDKFFAMLDAKVAAMPAPERLTGLLDTFDGCRERLKVRVRAASELERFKSYDLCVRPVAPGLVEQLVIDGGNHRLSLPNDAVRKWKVEPELVWRAALENLRADRKPHKFPGNLMPLGDVEALEGGPYTSAHLRCLDLHLPAERPFGVLVGVPRTGLLLFHVLRDQARFTPSLQMLEQATRELHARNAETDDEPVSPKLFWWREGLLRPLPAHRGDDVLALAPDERFLDEVLARLPPRAG